METLSARTIVPQRFVGDSEFIKRKKTDMLLGLAMKCVDFGDKLLIDVRFTEYEEDMSNLPFCINPKEHRIEMHATVTVL